MSGTAGKVYIPELMIGINASSANVDSSKEFLTDFLGDEILESMGGFPVSKTAMEQAFVPNPQDYVEGQPMYYAASSDPEGNMIEEQIWWPVDGDLEPFYRMVGGGYGALCAGCGSGRGCISGRDSLFRRSINVGGSMG